LDMRLPERISSEEELDEIITRPTQTLVEFIGSVSSPLVILGAGGKMGPSLAVLARRAAYEAGHPLEVVAVSRFRNPHVKEWLEAHDVQTISCDLFSREGLTNLPDAENIIYLVGLKFGTNLNPSLTWAFNALIPFNTCERYPQSRIVALSSGNVYPLVHVKSGGSVESDQLTPLGEYANSCIARERIFEYSSFKFGVKVAMIRLNYALDLRYGVFYDIASTIFQHQPVDVTMGYVTCIWQGDANDLILRALDLANLPTEAYNLTGLDCLSIRELAEQMGDSLGFSPEIIGHEASTALLSNPSRICSILGKPQTALGDVLRCTASWVRQGGRSLNKATHFEVRDGGY
jgi:nucleoside-diphosphate-sugar epimerase